MESERSAKKNRSVHYYDLDAVRAIACAAVLLYHLGLIKGGFLAVCTFFVLSGYLETVSALRKDRFSLIGYYGRRFLQVYVPLAAAVFISLVLVSLLPDKGWLNMKPETGSVLLGYNNWWQISALQDYFARHISSPFMHMWYIAIQLQFDAVFPLLFLLLNAMRKRGGRTTAFLLLSAMTALSAAYMLFLEARGDTIAAYYDTFARVNALLAGMMLGLFRKERTKETEARKAYIFRKSFFFVTVAGWILMMAFIGPEDGCKALVFAVPVSVAAAWAGSVQRDRREADGIFSWLSGISYEVYLFQYPVIFLAQELFPAVFPQDGTESTDPTGRIAVYIIEVAAILILAWVLRTALSGRWEKKRLAVRAAALCAVVLVSAAGARTFVLAKDHTAEMQELDKLLKENAAMLEQKQEEALARRQQEETDWEKELEEIQAGESGLEEAVRQLPIAGIGDSVMLGAVMALYDQFPNGYFDAATSRTTYAAAGVISSLEEKGVLGDIVVFNLGANGEKSDEIRENIVEMLAGKKIYWMTNTNPKTFWINDRLRVMEEKYDNVKVIDWKEISEGHNEYFAADGLHLTSSGQKAFAKAIFDTILEEYREEWRSRTDALMEERQKAELRKVVFYGNDLLTQIYPHLSSELQEAQMKVISGGNDVIYSAIRTDAEREEVPHRVVLVFDRSAELEAADYLEIAGLLPGHEIITVVTEGSGPDTTDSFTVISPGDEEESIIMADGIHLTENGCAVLAGKIENALS